ncbi:MAG: DUF1501 domain-containing protein, partial [Lentisphaeraceae bacterium]|nr:DUF1501 domain-containing protein [Lentisphaeraceae bacterium]
LGMALPVGLPSLAAQNREADPYEGPFYVVFNAAGGWDTTYLMDPKGVGEINRLYKNGDIQTKGNINYAPIAKHIEGGMSNKAFFEKYGSELLVINGIDYSVNNHTPCERYMATGKLDSLRYPTFAALVAACKGPDQPIAFLTFGNYSGTGNIVPMSRVPYVQSLTRISNADHVHGNASSPYHDDFALQAIEKALDKQFKMRQNSARLPRVERAENMLFAAQLNSKALKRVTPHIPKELPKGRLERQAEIALCSFKAGVAVSANLNIGQFDSHANNDKDQMKLIPEFLAGIDYLVNRSEALDIRDKLVIVIQSEMGRTPHYNAGNGKDHWSIGSIMFMGAGIAGNRVIGKTDDGQFLKTVDPKSLKLSDKGIRIRPEHLHCSLRQLAGIEEHPLSKKFPFKVPEEEKLTNLWKG